MVRLGPILKTLAVAAALLVIGNGCGGFNATPAFSPLMFFLPGLADNKHPAPHAPPKTTPAETHGDLALLN
jgi:hypothetical protein